MENMDLSSLFSAASAPAPAAPGGEMGDGMGEGMEEEKSPMERVEEAMEDLDPKDVLQYMIDRGLVDKETKLIEPSMAAEGEGEEGPDFSQMATPEAGGGMLL